MRLLGRRGLVLVAVTSLVVGLAAFGGGVALADTGSGDIVSEPVAFDVVTRNDSGLPCDTSNPLISLIASHHETVRGHITGPRSALYRGHLDGTLYSTSRVRRRGRTGSASRPRAAHQGHQCCPRRRTSPRSP